jgi:hypothetical protein
MNATRRRIGARGGTTIAVFSVKSQGLRAIRRTCHFTILTSLVRAERTPGREGEHRVGHRLIEHAKALPANLIGLFR